MTRIFLHGMGHRADSWRATIDRMQGGKDVLCPDLRDMLGGQAATYDHLRAAFAAYMARMGEHVHLCGLSLGGVLALDFALAHPERLASLVLIGTPLRTPGLPLALQSAVFSLMPERAFAGMAFGKRDIVALSRTMKALDFRGELGRIACPALIVCGEKDGANMDSAKAMAKDIPGARLEVVPASGHVVSEDNPAALARLLDAWYDGTCAAT